MVGIYWELKVVFFVLRIQEFKGHLANLYQPSLGLALSKLLTRVESREC